MNLRLAQGLPIGSTRGAVLRRLAPIAIAAAVLFAIACGSGDSAAPAAAGESGGDAAPDVVASGSILHSDRSFTIDDFIAAGWKKSRQYSTDTVPAADDIWLGFFNRKDIEVRFYPTQQDAATQGVESAEAAMAKKLRQGGSVGASNRGAGSAGVTKFQAYLVSGNTVMLCELDIEVCADLDAAMTGP